MLKMSCLKNDLSLIYDVKTNCPSIVNKDEKLTQNKMSRIIVQVNTVKVKETVEQSETAKNCLAVLQQQC